MASEFSSWSRTFALLCHPRVVTMLFLGFSAGIPILLIFSSLSLWLREAGFERTVVTYFSWAALGYSFKFVWAPLVDQLPLPWLTRVLGRRRAWMLLAQAMIAIAILLMAAIDPQRGGASLTLMALAAVLLGFSSATQDIVIDAYRIESAEVRLQAIMASTYIVGYRLAMLTAGAGSLHLAQGFGSSIDHYDYQAWQITYAIMALTMIIGITTTLVIREPEQSPSTPRLETTYDYVRFVALFAVAVSGLIGVYLGSREVANGWKSLIASGLGNEILAGSLIEMLRLAMALTTAWLLAVIMVKLNLVRYEMVERTYLIPVSDFFSRYGGSFAWLLLALIGLYRISDIVLGTISNVFYYDLGFSKSEIANVAVTLGLVMTIVGGILGGLLAARFGVLRILLLGAVLAASTNLLFMLLAKIGQDINWFYLVIAIDNFSAGLASAAFIAFLSSLTNISFTAMQYAIFSSLMTLVPKSLGGYSGSIVDAIGYSDFFLLTAVLGLPVILLIIFAAKRFELGKQPV